MNRRKIETLTAAGFAFLIVLIVALLLRNGLRRSSHIVLPDLSIAASESASSSGTEAEAITPITVTPQTVQAAIQSLHRPDSYRRTVTIERLWDGGSGTNEVSVAVSGDWTRLDSVLSGGQTRHVITDGKETYIWYNQDKEYYHGPAGDISADQEQGIPTYEDILALSPEQIVTADYRIISGVNCIYVETGEDENGYSLRYWVSVDTGLLAVSERLEDGTTVYRMGSLSLDSTAPATEDFTLPDGTVLSTVGIN